MTCDLERRIAAALATEDTPSSKLEVLITETENAIVEAKEAAALEEVKALDPTISPDPKIARDAMEDAQFRVARLETLLPKLETRFEKRQKREEFVEWKKRYDELEPLRDALANEMREVYPAMVAQVADLMQRVSAFDRAASDLHGDRAAGVKLRLDSPELIARGLESFDRDHPPLSKNLQLPDFESGSRLIFPLPRQRAVPLALPYEPRYSPQWPEAARQRVFAVFEEQERVAEHYQKSGQRRERT